MKRNSAVFLFGFVPLLPSPLPPDGRGREKEEEVEVERRLYVIGISLNCRMWGWAFYCVCGRVVMLLGIHICIVFYYFYILFSRVFRDNIYSLHGMGSFFSDGVCGEARYGTCRIFCICICI